MTQITWDDTGKRLYETGVDHGVLYIPDGSGVYNNGVAWNGLTTVTESPAGAEATALYADNIKYLDIRSAETFGATIEAFTYPDEFLQFDGVTLAYAGVQVGQQSRKTFGMSYRTALGNDVLGTDYGYKLHLLWGLTAAPSEKAYATINDSPEAITFSWEVSSTPLAAGGALKATSLITIDSTTVDSAKLLTLTNLLYGVSGNPALPTPVEVLAIFGAGLTAVPMGTPANQPTYVSGTHIVTLPSVTGIVWKINGVVKTAGAQPALTVGQVAQVTATPATGYIVTGDNDWTFNY